jgi:hypothetical protein
MKKMWLSVFIFLTMWITEVKGQVLVSEVNIDTSLYTDNGIYHIYVYPDPTLMEGSDFLKKAYSCGMLIKVCQKKNGNAYDIYSFS